LFSCTLPEMWERILSQYLVGYLREYIKDRLRLDTFAVWSGDLVLEGVELRREKFTKMIFGEGSSLEVSQAWAKELRVHIPWRALQSESLKITFQSVELIVSEVAPTSPNKEESQDSIPHENSAEDVKDQSASSGDTGSKGSTNSDTPEKKGWLETLLYTIATNLVLEIGILVVKYVSDDIEGTVTCDGLSTHPASPDFHRQFYPITHDKMMHRIVQAEHMTFALTPLHTCMGFKRYRGAKKKDPRQAALQTQVLQKCSPTAYIKMPVPGLGVGDWTIDVHCTPLRLRLNNVQTQWFRNLGGTRPTPDKDEAASREEPPHLVELPVTRPEGSASLELPSKEYPEEPVALDEEVAVKEPDSEPPTEGGIEVQFDHFPLGLVFAAAPDDAVGKAAAVIQGVKGQASTKGVKVGWAITKVNGIDVSCMTLCAIMRLLREEAMPLRILFDPELDAQQGSEVQSAGWFSWIGLGKRSQDELISSPSNRPPETPPTETPASPEARAGKTFMNWFVPKVEIILDRFDQPPSYPWSTVATTAVPRKVAQLVVRAFSGGYKPGAAKELDFELQHVELILTDDESGAGSRQRLVLGTHVNSVQELMHYRVCQNKEAFEKCDADCAPGSNPEAAAIMGTLCFGTSLGSQYSVRLSSVALGANNLIGAAIGAAVSVFSSPAQGDPEEEAVVASAGGVRVPWWGWGWPQHVCAHLVEFHNAIDGFQEKVSRLEEKEVLLASAMQAHSEVLATRNVPTPAHMQSTLDALVELRAELALINDHLGETKNALVTTQKQVARCGNEMKCGDIAVCDDNRGDDHSSWMEAQSRQALENLRRENREMDQRYQHLLGTIADENEHLQRRVRELEQQQPPPMLTRSPRHG